MPTVNLYRTALGIPKQVQINNSSYIGGEGTVYFSTDRRYAVKIYHRNHSGVNKRRFLEQIMALGTNMTPDETQFLCWPIGLVNRIDNDDCFGCVTKYLPTPPYSRLEDIMLTPRQVVAQFQAGKSWANYLQVARGLARSVAVLHEKGCAHSDLSSRNFLVDINDSSVALIDLDGVVVQGLLPAQVGGSFGFMAPEIVMGKCMPNEQSDDHSLAVLILQTLLFRNVLNPLVCYDVNNQAKDELAGWGKKARFSEHPRDKRNRPPSLGEPLFQRGQVSYQSLTPALQQLTKQAFIDGLHSPNERPSARQWFNALSWAIDELWFCSRCQLHFPYPHWIKPANRCCPFCGQRIAPPFPSVLKIYDPFNIENYTFSNRHLVVGNGWKLFSDVLGAGQDPPFNRNTEQVVGHVEWDKQKRVFQMVNDDGRAWWVWYARNKYALSVPKGGSFPLLVGTTIFPGKYRRLLVVVE